MIENRTRSFKVSFVVCDGSQKVFSDSLAFDVPFDKLLGITDVRREAQQALDALLLSYEAVAVDNKDLKELVIKEIDRRIANLKDDAAGENRKRCLLSYKNTLLKEESHQLAAAPLSCCAACPTAP